MKAVATKVAPLCLPTPQKLVVTFWPLAGKQGGKFGCILEITQDLARTLTRRVRVPRSGDFFVCALFGLSHTQQIKQNICDKLRYKKTDTLVMVLVESKAKDISGNPEGTFHGATSILKINLSTPF